MDNEDVVSMDEFKAAFGIAPVTNGNGGQDPAQSTDGAADQGTDANSDNAEGNDGAQAQSQASQTSQQTDGSGEGTDGNKQDPTKQVKAGSQGIDKAAQSAETFAMMRITNSKYANILKGVANVLGIKDINLNDTEALADALNTKVTESLAKQQGISPELLQKVADLEKTQSMYQQKEIKDTALIGFENVKTKFQLDDAGLQAFAEELIANGKNPFLTKLNLVDEYKMLHFDELISQASQKAATTEAQRAARALDNGSNPGSKQGASTADTDPKKINSVKDLNTWFDEQTKGK